MPLYETVMQEKPPIVLDIGTAYTKLGYAAEAYPRKIIPSEVVISRNGKDHSLLEYSNVNELYDKMVDFLQMIFFKHLLVSPKERKIVIVEDTFGKTELRETLGRVLFRHFEVSSVLFVPVHMIALSTLAVDTAVVIDIGYSETTVMPVFCGVQIMQAFQDQSYGGCLIHKEIKRQLLEFNSDIKEEWLTEKVLEDIKLRLCFVTKLSRAQAYRNKEEVKYPPDIEYPIGDTAIITVPGRTRETAFEIMFEESNERDSLPHLIMKSIIRCPIDVRKPLLENIFIIGGSAIIMGLLKRVQAELEYLFENDKEYKEKLHMPVKFKFHKTVGRENFTAWLGASLCGGTDLVQTRSLTKETYMKIGVIPDWICLTDYRVAGS